MTATIPFILETFSKYNNLCFEGKLPPIPVKLTRARTFLGKVTYVGKRDIFGNVVRYEKFCMRVSSSFNLTEAELEDVVIHEMIHYYIALNNIKDSSVHGTVFRRMMETINREFGRNITIRHRSEEGAPSQQKEEYRANWLCVTQLQDGSWGITSCAKTRVFEMHRSLPKYYRLKSLEWYGSIDPFFNRYPRSIKPRIYRITRAELDEHLKDSTLLKCDGHTIEPA